MTAATATVTAKREAELLDAARRARQRAYAPYSNFAVGAAVLGGSGALHIGANVENASYSLTCCAERVAVFNARLAGETSIVAVAVVTDAEPPATPCGSCRQVLSELAAGDAPIFIGGLEGPARLRTSVGELLPHGFRREQLSSGRLPA